MSLLTEALPDSIMIANQKCKIHTDHKTWIKFTQMISSNFSYQDRMVGMLDIVFGYLPPSLSLCMPEVMKFYLGDVKESKSHSQNSEEKSKRIYDFDYDADYIFAAFWQQYKIDLQIELLHWWKFKALFHGLTNDTQIVKIMEYRSIDLKQVKDKEQYQHYKRLKELYRLPDYRTEAQKEQDMMKSIATLF